MYYGKLYYLSSVQYIGKSTTAEHWTSLCEYAQTVSTFIVTDAAADFEAQISLSALYRFARHQLPLFPSLSHLVIIEADASIAHLELLVTPSLKSLEVSCIPDAQQSNFFSFLTAIEEGALLQTLILGPGRFESRSLQIISQFNNLRHLELKPNEDSEIPSTFFDNIGCLPKLETLILDARYVSSTMTKNLWQPSSMNASMVLPAFEDVNSLYADSIPDSNFVDGKSKGGGAGGVLVSQNCHLPISTSGSFNQLAKLHVIGWLTLFEDLMPRITSTKLEDVSITFIRLSYDELKVSLAKEQAQGRLREEIGTIDWQAEEQRFLKEQEYLRLASQVSFDSHTVFCTELIRTLYHRWTISLKAVSICQLDGSFQQLLEPPCLPEEMFRELLLLPAIENLEMNGWMLDSVDSVINVVESISNLKSLLLPLDETNSGISLPTLRHVAETCPRLEIFQTRIEPLYLIPEYDVPTTEALSHGLRTLSMGNSSLHMDFDDLYLIARHLYLLFPNLTTINSTFPEYNAEQWSDLDRWMKVFQTARIDDMNRRPVLITNDSQSCHARRI